MYEVTVGNVEYRVMFEHTQHMAFLEPDPKAATVCYLMLLALDEKIAGRAAMGVAWCHPNDNFDKNTGRKLSLARALKDAGFDRNVRELFWRGYFEARGRID